MALLAGVLSLDEEWCPHRLAEQLAKDSCRYPDLQSKMLFQDSRVSCYGIEKQTKKSQSLVASLSESQKLVFSGNIADSEITQQNLVSQLTFPIEDSLFHLNGFWIALIYDQIAGTLCFVTDLLGVEWMYVARFENGYMFSSDFGALASNFPGTLTVDDETLLVIFGINYSPTNTTCFKEVSVMPGGSVIELTHRGMNRIKKQDIAYGDKYAALSQGEKFEVLDSVLDTSIKGWCGNSPSDLLLSLSGGYDSRYGLGLLQDHSSQVQCLTFGHPRSHDVRVARSLCQTVGIPFSHFNVTHNSWSVWKRSVERLGTTGGYQFACGWADEWLTLLSQKGDQVILGFLGDAYSGKHLQPLARNNGNWLSNWEEWSLDEGWVTSELLRSNARKQLNECMRDRFAQQCGEATFVFPHQKAMHLDLYGRQRRFVASQVNLLFSLLCPLPFFYTKEGIEFWSNLPFQDLNNQILYKSYAQARFSDLFKPEARPGLSQRIYGSLKNEVIKFIPGTKPFLSPTELDDRGMLAQNRAHFIELVEHMYPLVDKFFDTKKLLEEIHLFPNSKQLNSVQLMRLVNVLILASLSAK